MVEEINYLQHQVPEDLLVFFRKQAEQKIQAENWAGRNKEVKIQNFVHCWVTEEAFKQILIKEQKWFRHRGLYFGDAAGCAPVAQTPLQAACEKSSFQHVGSRRVHDGAVAVAC